MLLGECLAAALVRSVGYRQVAQRLLDIAETQAEDPVLLFVVARAFSKLAEIDPQLVDTSVLLRLARQLDGKDVISNEQKSVETLLARVLGKLRGTPAGDLLIKTLIEAGRSSRIAGIIGISMTYHRGAPVFYVSELKRAHEQRDAEEELHRDPPSRRMLALLFASIWASIRMSRRRSVSRSRTSSTTFPAPNCPAHTAGSVCVPASPSKARTSPPSWVLSSKPRSTT